MWEPGSIASMLSSVSTLTWICRMSCPRDSVATRARSRTDLFKIAAISIVGGRGSE